MFIDVFCMQCIGYVDVLLISKAFGFYCYNCIIIVRITLIASVSNNFNYINSLYCNKQIYFTIMDKLLPCLNQIGFIRSEGKCYNYQNYSYHTWHQCVYKGRYVMPKGGFHPLVKDHSYQKCCCVVSCVASLSHDWEGMWSIMGGLAAKMLRWRAGVSCRTSSQIWNSWNLPMFLLRDGSLTLMYMASSIVL